jgi:hypothetical protein
MAEVAELSGENVRQAKFSALFVQGVPIVTDDEEFRGRALLV